MGVNSREVVMGPRCLIGESLMKIQGTSLLPCMGGSGGQLSSWHLSLPWCWVQTWVCSSEIEDARERHP